LTWETIPGAALRLPESERMALAARLLKSLPPDIAGSSLDDDSLEEELDRRFGTLENGIEWPELRKEPDR
jgi:hypothetical protein